MSRPAVYQTFRQKYNDITRYYRSYGCDIRDRNMCQRIEDSLPVIETLIELIETLTPLVLDMDASKRRRLRHKLKDLEWIRQEMKRNQDDEHGGDIIMKILDLAMQLKTKAVELNGGEIISVTRY
ncbi:uncharacterized protein H6S33_010964 [Morchella sextelata]|jgi:hypothetical protein|uniref:uncharacterized protein n=1 Tax=Morchella sextelata TaxID=1174677 RepID=UPI001D04B235|nr:uncharacterized protein H6S33_010964 [Morchella sextelata]KAH0611699.1 hypothetical protein H6S33_010964 [Morchella sextelata]